MLFSLYVLLVEFVLNRLNNVFLAHIYLLLGIVKYN